MATQRQTIAILCVGQIRTFCKCIPYWKRDMSILSKTYDIDAYFCISTTHESDMTDSIKLVKETMTGLVKNVDISLLNKRDYDDFLAHKYTVMKLSSELHVYHDHTCVQWFMLRTLLDKLRDRTYDHYIKTRFDLIMSYPIHFPVSHNDSVVTFVMKKYKIFEENARVLHTLLAGNLKSIHDYMNTIRKIKGIVNVTDENIHDVIMNGHIYENRYNQSHVYSYFLDTPETLTQSSLYTAVDRRELYNRHDIIYALNDYLICFKKEDVEFIRNFADVYMTLIPKDDVCPKFFYVPEYQWMLYATRYDKILLMSTNASNFAIHR